MLGEGTGLAVAVYDGTNASAAIVFKQQVLTHLQLTSRKSTTAPPLVDINRSIENHIKPNSPAHTWHRATAPALEAAFRNELLQWALHPDNNAITRANRLTTISKTLSEEDIADSNPNYITIMRAARLAYYQANPNSVANSTQWVAGPAQPDGSAGPAVRALVPGDPVEQSEIDEYHNIPAAKKRFFTFADQRLTDLRQQTEQRLETAGQGKLPGTWPEAVDAIVPTRAARIAGAAMPSYEEYYFLAFIAVFGKPNMTELNEYRIATPAIAKKETMEQWAARYEGLINLCRVHANESEDTAMRRYVAGVALLHNPTYTALMTYLSANSHNPDRMRFASVRDEALRLYQQYRLQEQLQSATLAIQQPRIAAPAARRQPSPYGSQAHVSYKDPEEPASSPPRARRFCEFCHKYHPLEACPAVNPRLNPHAAPPSSMKGYAMYEFRCGQEGIQPKPRPLENPAAAARNRFPGSQAQHPSAMRQPPPNSTRTDLRSHHAYQSPPQYPEQDQPDPVYRELYAGESEGEGYDSPLAVPANASHFSDRCYDHECNNTEAGRRSPRHRAQQAAAATTPVNPTPVTRAHAPVPFTTTKVSPHIPASQLPDAVRSAAQRLHQPSMRTTPAAAHTVAEPGLQATAAFVLSQGPGMLEELVSLNRPCYMRHTVHGLLQLNWDNVIWALAPQDLARFAGDATARPAAAEPEEAGGPPLAPAAHVTVADDAEVSPEPESQARAVPDTKEAEPLQHTELEVNAVVNTSYRPLIPAVHSMHLPSIYTVHTTKPAEGITLESAETGEVLCKPVRTCIDTGSNMCLLVAPVAEASGIRFATNQGTYMRTSGGGGTNTLGKVTTPVNITLCAGTPHATRIRVPLHVVPGPGRSFELLLGTQFINSLGCVIDAYQSQLIYRPHLLTRGDATTTHSIPLSTTVSAATPGMYRDVLSLFSEADET